MSPDIENQETPLAKLGPQIAGAAILLVLAVAAMSRVGCGNHHTPAGHAGYVRSTPLVGAGEYVGTQLGPTSTGWVWRQKIVNIDIRSRTFSEDMTIPTSDRLRVELRAHARIRPQPTMIRELVDEFGGENWYISNVRDQFRSAVRNRVQVLKPFDIKDRMRRIGDEVLADMQERYKGKPVIFESVDIGDINYPEKIVAAVVRKIVTNEDNLRAEIEADIASEQIEIGIAEAEGISKAQAVIRKTLDPMFLQFEALRAIEDLADSENTNFLIMPMSQEGSSPVIMQLGK